MELARYDEQSYQLELHAYEIIFLDFKHKPPSFVFMEIGTNSRILVTPSMVQLVTKLINPLRDGTSLEIIPLPIQTFTIHVLVTIIVNQPMKGNERSDKEQVEPFNLSFTVVD